MLKDRKGERKEKEKGGSDVKVWKGGWVRRASGSGIAGIGQKESSLWEATRLGGQAGPHVLN